MTSRLIKPKGRFTLMLQEGWAPGVLCGLNLHSAWQWPPTFHKCQSHMGVKLNKILTPGLESLTWQFQSKVSKSTSWRSLPRYFCNREAMDLREQTGVQKREWCYWILSCTGSWSTIPGSRVSWVAFLKILFIWLCWVVVAAHGIFGLCYSMWDL